MQFATLAANSEWFSFRLDGVRELLDPLAVYAFTGIEEANKPYEFTVELLSRNNNLDLTQMLGKTALLTVRDRSGGQRFVHGVIRQMEQLHTANAFTHYRAELVPRLYFLGQTHEQRIYQHQSVEQIIDSVLRRHGFSVESFAFQLREKYEEREYCVQYESDLHFLDRLCEEEGWTYSFEHSDSGHRLIFTDAESGPSISGESLVRFYAESGTLADSAVISRLNLRHRINSNKVTYREWNFTRPNTDLQVKENAPEWEDAPTPSSMSLETYMFPHLYQQASKGERYAKIQLLRQLAFREWAECTSDIARFLPGHTFILHSHPRLDANRKWWVHSVRHEGKQPMALEHEAPDDRGLEYTSTVVILPDTTRFVPELLHKKVRVEGLQSAIVTGPPGEEIFVDQYGRVKVQFHWDRLGRHDENTTCWVRVADTWAGTQFGFIQLPRIGQEVMVEFMEGDPDRPVITGRTYNANNMPPWELPQQRSLSGIQSREIKGAQRNQLLFDDTSGQVQAQLASDYGTTQLNLGYITRVNHREGRRDFRGEGFELRTDRWGVMRASRGMYISTYPRGGAEQNQKAMSEAIRDLEVAVRQHKDTAELAEVSHARDYTDGVQSIVDSLRLQYEDVKGDGSEHSELQQPHLVMASPAGIAMTTPESTHIHSGEHVAITSEQQTTLSSAKSFLVSAKEMVGIFACKLGMRLMAAKGKVEIEAQSDEMTIIADKDMKMFSAHGKVHVSSPKEIFLTAGGSYIRINENGIEQGTNGEWKVHAANQNMDGPRSESWLNREWKEGIAPANARVVVRDELGKVLAVERYATGESGLLDPESTGHALHLINTPDQENESLVHVEQDENKRVIAVFGSTVNLTADRKRDIEGE